MILILHYLPALICGIHAVRTGRQQTWLWILIVGGSIGAAVYFFAVIVPELSGGRTGRAVGKAAQQALDPERDYRNALRALDDTPSIGNRMRLANAAAALGRWSDAEAQWALCAGGHGGDDPAVLLGHAEALLELNRAPEALKSLEHLRSLGGPESKAPLTALAFARAYEALGRNNEADEAYRYAADRVPGLEAGGRYVAFMAKTGRREDAEVGFAELDRRLSKIAPPLRAEARIWRDLAAKALGRT
ncbi:hypothetical protein [Terricaulis sp.]|uniref:hypothetical protein n=1 Tax=Terricaulis sp. TaxID=2768686 RepID=UPI002AC796F6|nr:hypothetical protein [Terricaulis sp.]MDZ4689788.1 hypothetical protein [Terricaulis sp.]